MKIEQTEDKDYGFNNPKIAGTKLVKDELTVEELEKQIKTKTGGIVTGYSAPKGGGLLTHISTFKHPYKGVPDHESTLASAVTKRLVPIAINTIYKRIKKHLPDPDEYCPFVRELHRVANIWIDREKYPEQKAKMRKVRDIFCFWAQIDNAYRYKLQDVLPEVNMDKVKLDEGDKEYCDVRADYSFKHQRSDNKSNQ